jgi:hypothetical protein
MEVDDIQVGDPVVISGFGLDERGDTGQLQVAVERLREVRRDTFEVSGDTPSGACLGDSGGPLLVRSESAGGAIRVAGILSRGDVSCRERDTFVKTSAISDWLTAAGWRSAPDKSCRAIGREGRCFDTLAVYCDGAELTAERCSLGSPCGWDGARSGYRCASAPECLGDRYGVCVEGGVEQCSEGNSEFEACPDACATGADGRATCVVATASPR